MLPTIKRSLADNIKNELREHIRQMNLRESAKLPAENEIAKSFGVSRVTIRRALDDLEKEGLVFRSQGRGTFVNPEALQIRISLNPAQEFGNLIRQGGFTPRISLVQVKTSAPSAAIANRLQIGSKEQILVVEKSYYADEHLAIVCIDHFPLSLFPQLPTRKEWQLHSLFSLLRERAGKIISWDKVEILTKSLTEMETVTSEAKKMNCASVLELVSTVYDQDNFPVLYGVVFYNTDYIRFNLLRTQDVF